MTYSFAFALSPQERTDLANRNRRGARFQWRSTTYEVGWALIATSSAVTGTLGWILQPTPQWQYIGTALAGWTYIALLVVPAVFRRLTNGLIGTYGVATPVTVTVDARGVTEVMEHATPEQWGWDELRNVRSGKDGVVLEFRDGKSCRIPARAFKRAMKRDEVVEFADRMRRPPEIVEHTILEPQLPVIAIPSGEWRWTVEADSPERPPHTLTLIDASDARNTLTIELDEFDEVSVETIPALARNPERRTLVDGDGVEWRISFPQDDLATAVAAHWPSGSVEPPRVAWVKTTDGTEAPDLLPWKGLGHLTHAELLEWFKAQRSAHRAYENRSTPRTTTAPPP